jgi:2,3-bisphosphoglycerate-independent phosphoglycerate mutase
MRSGSHFLFLFLDGVGIGERNPEVNPFFSIKLEHFERIFGGIPSTEMPAIGDAEAFVEPSDPLLGVEGLPQSGTGQTSLFTGVNAAKLIEMHFGPYPHSQIRPLLEEKNIFRVLKELGADVYFANAFPRQFFEYVESGHRKLSATTMSCMTSGVPLCNADSLRAGESLSADITAERWPKELGYPDVVPLSAVDAGRRLRDISVKHDFTMFEYFLTDKAGHDMNRDMAEAVLTNFDQLLGGLADGGLDKTTLLISSDHGNVEDISVKTHTLNPSLTAVAGEHAAYFKGRVSSICDITPRIVQLFKEHLI